MSGAFYNEWERYPAQWIRNLAAAGHVADGVVDERSIRDVRAVELVGDVGEWLADGSSGGRREWRLSRDAANGQGAGPSDGSGLGDADRIGAGRVPRGGAGTQAAGDRARGVDGHVGDDADAPGAWSDVEWIACTDGKSRPAQPGVHPLVAGTTNRVGRLRAYGNAIVAPLAAEFIGAVMDELDARSAA